MSRFQISAGALVGALKAVSPAVERCNSIPILSHVLMAASDKGLSVSATDLDLQLDATYPLIAPPSEPFEFTVDPRAVLAATANLPRDWPVSVEVEPGQALFSWQWGQMRLLTLHASDFPKLSDGATLASIDIPEKGLRCLEDVRPCISNEETRYYLNGVFLDRDKDGSVLLVATDGHRMGVARTGWSADGAKPEARAIAARKFADLWMKGFSRVAHQVRILDGNKIEVISEGRRLVGKTIDGSFPEWRRVVPKEVNRAAVVSRHSLLQALHAATRFSAAVERARSRSVTLSVDDGKAVVECKTGGADRLALNCGAARGPDKFWFGVNAPYLIHAIARMQGDEITLIQNGEGEPVLLKEEAVDFIVMPLRTAEPAFRKAA